MFKKVYLRMRRFSAFLLGFVFIFSGILKLLDPVGASLVTEEYFKFFHVGFMEFSSGFAAVFMALLETVVGIALVTGVWRKVTAVFTLTLMFFFTLITLLLLIFNPDMDCGCFGEAVHLTHLQTFIKSLVMLAMALFAFLPFKDFGSTKKRKYISFTLVVVTVLIFSAYSVLYIPMVDFTDFKPSSRISSGSFLQPPPDKVYDAVFIYEKNGKKESFTLENLPDSTWTYVDTETRPGSKWRLREGTDPVLSFYDAEGNYADSLAESGAVLVISVYDMEKLSWKKYSRIADFILQSGNEGFVPLLLAASSHDDFMKRISGGSLSEEEKSLLLSAVYTSDFKTLITLNRSNAGATYINEGYIVKKWAGRNLPDREELAELASMDQTEVYLNNSTSGNLKFQAFMLYIVAVMLLV